ncbi:MAG TPA: hypothetical protein VN886_10500 [Acidimicrobiales bacterium]|nr:hypothetical protein [Acidimicrobiales bacterium]
MTDLMEAAAARGEPAAAVEAVAAAEHGLVGTLVPAGAPPTGWRARARPLLRPAGYYLVSRAVVIVAAFVYAGFNPTLDPVPTMGSIFDGRWYLLIAQHGYPHRLFNEGDGSRWAFFPAFPTAVRGLAEVTGLSLPDAAVVAAFVFGLTSAVAIWLAVREVFGAKLADGAVLLLVFCPTAYVLSLGYTEGLFLTAAAGCLFALARRWWITAALCACVAGLSRNAGIVVILAVLVTAVPVAWRERAARPAVAAVVAPLGLASFMAYGWAMVGTPLAFLSSEKFWHGQHFVWFRTPIEALVDAVHGGPAASTFVPDALAGGALVVGLLGLWWLDQMTKARTGPSPGTTGVAVRAIPFSWWVYTIGALVVAYSAYFTDSIPRYAMAAFPLFVAFAWKLPARLHWAAAAVMACLQCALVVAVLTVALHPVAVPIVP